MPRPSHIVQSGWKELLKGYESKLMSAERLQVRLQGEGTARQLMEEHLGKFSREHLQTFLSALNTDFINDKERHDRFRPAFLGNQAKQIADSLEAFNRWSQKLWTTEDSQLDDLLDEFWQKNEVAGAGTSLPTAILYLRDPDSYAIWIPGLEQGLKTVLPALKLKKRRTAAGYRIYNKSFQSVRQQLELTTQAMDVILTETSKDTGAKDKDGFETLFNDFIVEYVDSKEGEKHLRSYTALRQEAKASFKSISEMEARGDNITDQVLLKLLPYADTANNRSRGAWIHIAPAITRDIRQWFEGAKWTKPEDWPAVSRTIFGFIKRCLDKPEALAEHCQWFAETVPSKGFQMGMVTPILNALKPDAFNIINDKPRNTLNHFCKTDYEYSLQAYPELNKLNFSFQDQHREQLVAVGQDTALPGDVLDMFTHWLVAVRKFSFKQTKVYKIAPGPGGEYWEQCRDNGYIAIGWNELGDLSGISKEEFEERRDTVLLEFTDWTKSGVGQVWRFSRIQEGDLIIANSGTNRILGFGTVIGPYYYVANTQYGHRLPVMWDDVTPRKVNEASWVSALQKVSADRFEQLRKAEEDIDTTEDDEIHPPIIAPSNNPEYPLEQCSTDTGFAVDQLGRWLGALDRRGQAIFYGPPGTGKTFLAEKLARHLIGGNDGFVKIIQFHPEYAYQDFMQGIRPIIKDDGGLSYKNVPGVFKVFCDRARDCQGPGVLIIDEINRANLARVFGELMYLLEYRNQSVELAGGGSFSIPENIRIIGTMNTADRSIALVDYALRRRFAFIRLAPDYEVLEKAHEETGFDVSGLINVMKDLNTQIGDPHYEVGISFFLVDNLETEIEDIWHMEIEPYLEEYFFDNVSKAEQFSWEKVKGKIL